MQLTPRSTKNNTPKQSSTIAQFSKDSRLSGLNNLAFKSNRPDVLVIDLRNIFIRYSPNASIQSWIYRNDPILRLFVERFTIHRLIESGFILPYDALGQEGVLWEFVESLFPEGTGDFENSTESMTSFQLLHDAIIEEVDTLLRLKVEPLGLATEYTDYLFDRWITHSAAAFVHKDYMTRGY